MEVQNITVTVHFYLPLMRVHYIANNVHSDSPLMSAFSHSVHVTVILLCSMHPYFSQVIHSFGPLT